MPDEKNPYEAFREEAARLNISATKDIDDPEDALQQDQIDRNRVDPNAIPKEDDASGEGQPS